MTNEPSSNLKLLAAVAIIALLALIFAYVPSWFGSSGSLPPNSVHVKGTVTFQGQPLVLGLIVFEPDPSKGGSGQQGFANIKDGQFDTKHEGRAAAIGPTVIRITGGDGIGIDGFTPFGNLLFEEYITEKEITAEADSFSFDVPPTPGYLAPERD